MISCREVIEAVLSAVIAAPCAVCGDVLEHPLDGAVCGRCWQSVVGGGIVNPASPAIVQTAAIGAYDGTLREILHAFKYDSRRSVAPHLSRLMSASGSAVLAGADCCVPVPLHRRRLRQRGFNQAADLARGLGLPVVAALRRVRQTRAQVELPAAERQSNVADAFSLARSGRARDVAGRIVVLVDDVATTGATLEACATVLMLAGAHEVRALTAARVASPRPPSQLP